MLLLFDDGGLLPVRAIEVEKERPPRRVRVSWAEADGTLVAALYQLDRAVVHGYSYRALYKSNLTNASYPTTGETECLTLHLTL